MFRKALRPAQLGYGLSRRTLSEPSATPSLRPSRRLTYVLYVELKNDPNFRLLKRIFGRSWLLIRHFMMPCQLWAV